MTPARGFSMRGETLIFFDGQFWVALFSEERFGEVIRVGQYTFGAEPSPAVFDQWLADGCPGLSMHAVQRFGAKEKKTDTDKKKNPKRAIREVMRSLNTSNETKAQKEMREKLKESARKSKQARSQRRKEIREQRFLQKQLKKKKKQRS